MQESLMKINVFLPHLRIAGGVKIALMYADKLQARGHDVRVYVRSTNKVRRTVANIFGLGGPAWLPGFSPKITRVPYMTSAFIRDADVSIATTYDTALLLEELSESKGRPFYLLQHDEGLYHAPRDLADKAYRTRARKIVVSTWLKDLLKDGHDQDADLLINPIDLEQFSEVPIDRTDNSVRVLLLHHTYPWKGTEEGVRVVQEIKSKHPEVRLIAFGVREKEGVGSVYDEYHFDVAQDKLAELYSGVDIYLCPSWDEGFGLPSIEAMACGTALVTYDNGGSRDYAYHEETALVAKRKDEKGLAHQLERMVTDSSLRATIAKKGKNFVLAMPGWDERTRELEALLQQKKA